MGGTAFLAHRVVLAAGSDVFRKLYSPAPGGEAASGGRGGGAKLTIANLDAASFEAVLRFLYAGECQLASARLLVPILDAAARLKISPLQDAAGTLRGTRTRGTWRTSPQAVRVPMGPLRVPDPKLIRADLGRPTA